MVRDRAHSRSAENRSPDHSVSILGGVSVFLGDFVAITDAIAERHETSVSDQSTGLWCSLPTRTVSSRGIEIPGALSQGRLLLIQPTEMSAR
jgi:hypothetical protein